MPPRLTILICTILTAIFVARCDHQVQYRQVPFPVQRYFQGLPAWQSPKKIEVDYHHRRIYWLNKQGEIKAVRADGSGEVLINKGIGARLGITYINDFTIDDQKDVLYFIDLMDISTGLGAIKKSDLNGNEIETIATFSGEAPYAVQWNANDNQLYYTTRQKDTRLHSLYRLGESTAFVTTADKADNISQILVTRINQANLPMVADHRPQKLIKK